MNRAKPIVLLILDGWGVSTGQAGDAIHAAHTPHWDHLLQYAPHIALSGCGEEVGLPPGQMGNSEVGHLTMGAGRIIDQDLSRITKAIAQGEFFKNPVLKETFAHMNNSSHTLHILGLLSPGGVHSHEDHLLACIKMAKENGVPRIFLHLFLDGRDTPPQSADASLVKLEQYIATFPGVQVASLSGRYYAMDRDQRWERVKRAYEAIVHAKAEFTAHSSREALQLAYARGETDEFVTPTCIVGGSFPLTVQSGDSLIYMNFRSDRARALSYAFCTPDFKGFDRGPPVALHTMVTLTEYDPTLPVKVAFSAQNHDNILGKILQDHHLTQLHLAETEKYAHVTFFFNGGIETPYVGETRVLIPSPKVATYDHCPEMSAFEITTVLVKSIQEQQYDFIICNFANADMVGHTGNFKATIKAIETLDSCLAKIIAAIHQVGAQALITSDHGNAECMLDHETNQPHTAHTTSLVPLVYVGNRPIEFTRPQGTLSDLAPTLLSFMGIPVPTEMTGVPLCKERAYETQ